MSFDDFDAEKVFNDVDDDDEEEDEQKEKEGDEEEKEDLGDLDVIEWRLVDEHPELALAVVLLDEQEARLELPVSKKQQRRDREKKLLAMSSQGGEDAKDVKETAGIIANPALNAKSGKRKEAWSAIFDEMERRASEGPFELPYRAVRDRIPVEVRVRSAVRLDRVFRGMLLVFDLHMNLLLKDVVETVLLGRQEQRAVGHRRRLNQLLPDFCRWRDGGNWPLPIGGRHIVQHRRVATAFIKGDSVVLVRLDAK